MSPILVKIALNPLLYITQSKNKIAVYYSYFYNGKSKIVHIGYFHNIVDALECRDKMIYEFYGVDCTGQYELIDESIKSKPIGDYIIDENGKCYNKYGIMLSNKKNKTYETDMFNIYITNESGEKIRSLISPEEVKCIFNGKDVEICTIRKRYISASEEKGFFYINEKKVINGCASPINRKPRNWVRSKKVKIPKLYGVTRSGRHTCYTGKVQSIIDGEKISFKSVGSFHSEQEANLFALDMYYLINGFFHKSDKRRLNNEI